MRQEAEDKSCQEQHQASIICTEYHMDLLPSLGMGDALNYVLCPHLFIVHAVVDSVSTLRSGDVLG